VSRAAAAAAAAGNNFYFWSKLSTIGEAGIVKSEVVTSTKVSFAAVRRHGNVVTKV